MQRCSAGAERRLISGPDLERVSIAYCPLRERSRHIGAANSAKLGKRTQEKARAHVSTRTTSGEEQLSSSCKQNLKRKSGLPSTRLRTGSQAPKDAESILYAAPSRTRRA